MDGEYTKEQVPSVGRAVHYVAYGTPKGEFPAGICRAATITEVYTVGPEGTADVAIVVDTRGVIMTVGLCVTNPSGLFFNRGIQYDPDKAPGTWHWPEYIPNR